jgi:UDP-N-acetylmuramyl pentapeptide phosphotransferase/UDP-N-acetylglucosamine-1-phosphate transferase
MSLTGPDPLRSLPAYLLGAFGVALVAVEIIRQVAIKRQLVDKPNERSLHSVPVPRIGGVGMVLAAALLFLAWRTSTGMQVSLEAPEVRWVACGIPVFFVGLVDDVKPLRSSVRFLLQIAVAALFLWLFQPFQINVFGGGATGLPIWLVAFAEGFWIVALINIYNFMDGMDGLAAAQAVFFGAVLALLGVANLHGWEGGLAALVSAAAAGFFVHNAPPARIFMGDGASTFLGYAFATLPMLLAAPRVPGSETQTFPLVQSVAGLAPFLADATFTLLRRASKGEKVWQAHRTHLYQRAVATGLGHRDVFLVYLAWYAWSALCAWGFVPGPAALRLGLALLPVLGLWLWVTEREKRAAQPKN